jgi:hypothetical protein
MGTITRSHSFVAGEKPTDDQWNVDIDQLFTLINGNLDESNIDYSSGDGIVTLQQTQTITGTKTFDAATTFNTSILPDSAGGADMGSATQEWGDVYVADDKFIKFGSDQNVFVGYDETTTDSLKFAATEGAGLAITLMADEGDDAGDEWKLNVADGGTLTLGNDIASAGTYVTHLTLTPNSTVASSTLAIAGHATVAGDATVSGEVKTAKIAYTDGDDALTIADGGGLTTSSTLNIGSVAAAGEDTDKFLVLDSSNNVDYRTGAQVLSDIGAQASGTFATLAYKTIAVSGQDNVVADAADDTLTLAAGSNITLTTNASSDTVTIAAASGGVDAANGADNRIATFSDSDSLNGEANLTFTGSALTCIGTVTVGVDDTGHDVKFFGATSGKYLEWDESADQLNVVGTADFADSNGNHVNVNTNPASGQKGIVFGYDNSNNYGQINALHTGTEYKPVQISANANTLLCTNSGKVEIGTAGVTVSSSADKLVVEDGANAGMTIYSTGTSSGQMKLSLTNANGADDGAALIYGNSNNKFFINSNGAVERFSIDANGFTTITNSTSSTPYGLHLYGSGGNPNNTTVFFLKCESSTETKAFIYSDGSFQSRANSYGSISDVKNKQDITDARSYWDDFAQVKFRKFRFKNDVAEYGDNAQSMLGVVAQEIETIFPNLVSESPDTQRQEVPILDNEGNDTGETEEKDVSLGTTTKSVKYSILNQIGLKVIQELQTRLEAAETKIAALEAA